MNSRAKTIKEYRAILHDYGGFDPAQVLSCQPGPASDYKFTMLAKLDEYEKKNGSIHDLIREEEDAQDLEVYIELQLARP